MEDKNSRSVDPDFFQLVVALLSALSDLATIFHIAGGSPGAHVAFDPEAPAAEQVRKLRKEYAVLFSNMDEALRIFGRYDGAMRNADAKLRVGFGSFLTNLTQGESREYKDLRREINQAATNIGIWTATIIENMLHHAAVFSKAAVLNHTELNDILRGDLAYSEIAHRYRDLKERVETFFEGLFKRANY